jgi:hypothetical protein
LSPAKLRPGKNVVAAEVHQAGPTSTDVVFDLRLVGYGPEDALRPARAAETAVAVVRTFRDKHYVPAAMKIPDGYTDGGRGSTIAADGSVRAPREVMVVDRLRDLELQRHVHYARSPVLASLPPLERATRLALYVDKVASPEEGRSASQFACTLLEAEFRGHELLLGKAAGAGMCRHRSLLFKVLADEAGLNVTLVRGNYGTPKSAGGHVWNELALDDGRKLLVDVMNPRPGFEFPETNGPATARYLTVKNTRYYSPTKTAGNE